MKKTYILLLLVSGLANSQMSVDSSNWKCPEVQAASLLWHSNVGKNGIRMVQYDCYNKMVIIHQNASSSNNHWAGSKVFKWSYLRKGSEYFDFLYRNKINEKYIWYWNNKEVYSFIIDYDEFD